MTILDRYLYAVQNSLPKDQPAPDIVAEIGDELQTQMDEREAALGRTLTEEEQADIVKAYGHPRAVAARYGRIKYLVGPELLPFYWSTLQLVATVVIAIELIGGAISAIVLHDGLRFFGALGAAFGSLIWIFGIVTVVFALGERAPRHEGAHAFVALLRWDPRRLPAPGARPPVPRGSALVEFVANFLALLVLLDAGGSHRIPLDAIVANLLVDAHATLTPVWHAAYVGAVAGTALVALAAIVVFVQPNLVAFQELMRAVASAIVIAGIAITLHAGPWIQPAGGPLDTIALYMLVGALVVLSIQLTFSVRALQRKPELLLDRGL